MKIIQIVVVVVTLTPWLLNAADIDNWKTLQDETKTLRIELARQGAYAFVTNRATTPTVAPHIHSQCWVDWLPRTNVEQIAYEQEKRGFGLDFIGEIEKLALPEISLDDIDRLEIHADRMLTIAAWLKTAGGYGNHVLKTWCEGIALSAMGGMSINPLCDTNRVQKLIARLDGLQENVARRVFILNEEAPHRYIMPKCATYDEAAKDLDGQCYPHKIETWNRYRSEGLKVLTFDKVKEDSPVYAFYVPDICDNGNIREWWQSKKHDAVCVYGLESNMADEIFQIMRFRTHIGNIPKPTEAEINDLTLAFRYRSRMHDVWRKWSKGEECYFMGADAILKIYGHTFEDWFTRELRSQKR